MRWIIILFFLILAVPALASDGVLEINQTCAVQTGCFAGDTAGFPVTINGSSGHSYHLTSDLVVPNENSDGIEISTDDVSIDLAGFAISGPVVCSGTPWICTPTSGTGSGVETSSSTLTGISVRNGSIRGMGSYGVQLGLQSEVTDLRVRWNRLDGIHAGAGSILKANAAFQNGGDGIKTTGAATISGNISNENAGDGIEASASSTVSGNTASQNKDEGIRTGGGCAVLGNAIEGNSGVGLHVNDNTGYSQNVISANGAGTVNGNGVNLGSNLCNGTTTCP